MRAEMMFTWAFIIIANIYFAVDKDVQGLSFLIIAMLMLLIDTFFFVLRVYNEEKITRKRTRIHNILKQLEEQKQLLEEKPVKRKRGRPRKIKPLHQVHFP